MITRPLSLLVFMALGLVCLACSRGGKGTSVGAGGATAAPDISAAECYKTAGAVACPKDPGDPSGQGLPAPGGVCTLPVCKPCGSARSPAFRDLGGTPQMGWCICVPRSDYVGVSIYSCRTTAEWADVFPQ